MKVSYGNQDLTICKRSFDLIYFQCDNKDKLIVDNQQFNITPGFKKLYIKIVNIKLYLMIYQLKEYTKKKYILIINL